MDLKGSLGAVVGLLVVDYGTDTDTKWGVIFTKTLYYLLIVQADPCNYPGVTFTVNSST